MMLRFLASLLLAVMLLPGLAAAHFLGDSQSREFHLLPVEEGGADMLIRFPLTFAYSAELADMGESDAGKPLPFLRTEFVTGVPFYTIDMQAIEADRAGFADFLLRDLRFSVDGAALDPLVRDVTLQMVLRDMVPPTGREALQAALGAPLPQDKLYVSEGMVVLRAHLPGLEAATPVSLGIEAAHFDIPEEIHISNTLVDHRSSPPQSLTEDGFWPRVMVLSGSPAAGFIHFIYEGIAHIIGGLDHVLFVLCLTLAAPSLRALILSVTGFTLGHSVTLGAGVLGYAPSAGWFIPTVELGVAASIAIMAALVLFRRSGAMRFGLAAGLGLLHGFGFAFMLSPMLGGDHVALPLAGFNIGVELGQLVLVIAAFAALMLIDRANRKAGRALRLSLAAVAAVIALSMVVERTQLVAAELASVSISQPRKGA